jgi:hypothetical protein
LESHVLFSFQERSHRCLTPPGTLGCCVIVAQKILNT